MPHQVFYDALRDSRSLFRFIIREQWIGVELESVRAPVGGPAQIDAAHDEALLSGKPYATLPHLGRKRGPRGWARIGFTPDDPRDHRPGIDHGDAEIFAGDEFLKLGRTALQP